MSKWCVYLALLASSLIICSFAWGEKITVDPNVPGAQARNVSSRDRMDPRLFQKVTYDSGYKRLHAVLKDIARISGVKIYCGQNTKDWSVRDIPLVVCVKDIQLGKLLRAITDATHTKFTSEISEDDSERSYRVYRRWKEKQEIDKLLETKHEAAIAHAKWKWSALAAYGRGKPFKSIGGIRFPRETWLMGRLIATTSPNSDARLLDGDVFRFSGSDPAVHDIMNELYRLKLGREVNSSNTSNQPATTPRNIDTDIESAVLEIRLQDSGESGGADLAVSFGPVRFGDTQVMDFMGSEMSSIDLLSDYDSEGYSAIRA